jgi:hypothetical protein
LQDVLALPEDERLELASRVLDNVMSYERSVARRASDD